MLSPVVDTAGTTGRRKSDRTARKLFSCRSCRDRLSQSMRTNARDELEQLGLAAVFWIRFADNADQGRPLEAFACKKADFAVDRLGNLRRVRRRFERIG